jgi:hypothetical protein
MSAARSLCAHLLAVIGVAFWLDEVWPGLLPPNVRIFALILGGGFLVMTLWFGVEEYFSGRKLKTYLSAGKGVKVIDTDKQI